MPAFSKRSEDNLSQCDGRLQDVMNEAIKVFDFSVVCGHRGEKEQNEAYNNGYSKLKFPASKHNKLPSLAVDVIPYPTGYKDEGKFFELADVITGIATKKGISLEWGGTWTTFKDYPHWQVREV